MNGIRGKEEGPKWNLKLIPPKPYLHLAIKKLIPTN